jgi:23S rRNA pseudouridine2605 synthase
MKRKTDNFNKFYNRKRNSAVKEEIKQEKKAIKKERQAAVDRHFEEKRNKRALATPTAPATANPAIRSVAPAKSGFIPKDKRTPAVRADPGNKPRPGAEPLVSTKPVKSPRQGTKINPLSKPDGSLPLNKYIAHAGVSSRRSAALLVKEGKVTVNGKPVTDPGTKVLLTDTVKVGGKKVTVSSHFVYILLNKPKDFLTTTSDPQGRKTVQQLIATATDERVYPIGRLDRNTSGVLLFTNDGDLSQKLSHPKNEVKKIYHAGLDKPLTKADFEKIINGLELEDGPAKVDVLAYADPKDKTQIGLEIHSGKNRIVRRIFGALGYDVKTLDRVMYAGLTKKNVPRGKWRLLTDKEIRVLKYLKS